MNRSPILGALLLIPAIAIFAVVGCTPAKNEKKGETTPVAKNGDGGTGKSKKKVDITTPTDGTIKGVVKFDGTPPEPKVDPRVAAHKDAVAGLCGVPAKDQLTQTWQVAKDGGVQGVVIALEPPAGKKFKITDELKKENTKTVHLDQPFCEFVPHVVALWPEVQTLKAKDSAKVNHNVKLQRGPEMPPFNKTLSPGDETVIDMKDATAGVHDASCDIHTWMSAKVVVFKNPYFAVTDKDGNFEIKHLPIDVPLTVKMWHDSTGKWHDAETVTLSKGTKELKLKIK